MLLHDVKMCFRVEVMFADYNHNHEVTQENILNIGHCVEYNLGEADLFSVMGPQPGQQMIDLNEEKGHTCQHWPLSWRQ